MKKLVLTAMAIVALAAVTANAGLIAYDDFSTYTTGWIDGQSGSPTGFAGSWQSFGGDMATVDDTTETFTQVIGPFRTNRALSSGISTGTVYTRMNVALGLSGFQAIELAKTAGGIDSLIQLTGGAGLGVTAFDGAAATDSAAITTNDGASHEWLIELNLDTLAGKIWIDPDIATFDPSIGGTTFTASAGFQLNAINVALFSGSAGDPIVLDDIQIGTDLASVGVPEPATLALLGLGGLVLRRRRNG